MKIHVGDTVVVIAGKDKGKQGEVLQVLAKQDKVIAVSYTHLISISYT